MACSEAARLQKCKGNDTGRLSGKRIRQVLDIQEDARFRDTCGSPLKRIGEKFVRRKLQVIPRQVKVLEIYNKLFALERKVETVAPSQRVSARKAREALLLDAYWEFVKKLDPVASSKLEEVVTYARNQKQCLNAFMEHGEVDISNNIAENAIRPFVVGRKNWLFRDTSKGADSSVIVYTLVETAKANDVELFSYLQYVLDNEEMDSLVESIKEQGILSPIIVLPLDNGEMR